MYNVFICDLTRKNYTWFSDISPVRVTWRHYFPICNIGSDTLYHFVKLKSVQTANFAVTVWLTEPIQDSYTVRSYYLQVAVCIFARQIYWQNVIHSTFHDSCRFVQYYVTALLITLDPFQQMLALQLISFVFLYHMSFQKLIDTFMHHRAWRKSQLSSFSYRRIFSFDNGAPMDIKI